MAEVDHNIVLVELPVKPAENGLKIHIVLGDRGERFRKLEDSFQDSILPDQANQASRFCPALATLAIASLAEENSV